MKRPARKPAVPAKSDDPTKALVKAIAMDIGKDTCAYVERMYPDVWKAGNSGFRLSLRNHIFNEIMGAIKVTDEGQIIARLAERKKHRRKLNTMYRNLRTKP